MAKKQKQNKKELDIRYPIMILSALCGISLYILGVMTKEIDTGYIVMSAALFVACIIEPLIVNIWRYYKAKAMEEKLQKEKAERDKILAEKRKKEREVEEAKHAAQMRAELLAASASADSELRVRSDRIRRN